MNLFGCLGFFLEFFKSLGSLCNLWKKWFREIMIVRALDGAGNRIWTHDLYLGNLISSLEKAQTVLYMFLFFLFLKKWLWPPQLEIIAFRWLLVSKPLAKLFQWIASWKCDSFMSSLNTTLFMEINTLSDRCNQIYCFTTDALTGEFTDQQFLDLCGKDSGIRAI